MGKTKFLPTTLSEFLTIYSPNKVKRDLANVKNVRQALAVQTPSLGMLKKQYGERQIEAYIKIWLIELNELINTTRPLNEAQIDETAYLILSEYSNVSIADINIIFKTAKMGGYGDLYGTLSIDKILKWFGDYFNERCNTAGDMSRTQADKLKYQDEKKYGERGAKEQAFKDFSREHKIKQMQEKHNKKDE